jgi:DNA/RNA endonuclease YhcR with UshA esterase domain
MLNPDCLRSRNGLATGQPGRRWLLPIFVAILCTNLTGQAPALASEEPLTPIARISRSLVNQEVTVQAVISSISGPSGTGPYVVTLAQGGATIPLIYWPSMQPQLGPKVKVGKLVRAKVTVGVYQDRLQLRINDPGALEVVSTGAGATTNATPAATTPPLARPTETATPAATTPPRVSPTETVIGKIKADWVDRAVIISGTVSGSETTGKGWQLKVQDATGEIPVVLGEKTLAGLAVAEVLPGWVVTVTGPVKVYEGKPAVVPEVAGAVKFTPQ